MTRQELFSIQVEELESKYYRKVKTKWDSIAKPLDSLGVFESMTARIAAVQKTERPSCSKAAVLVMCADNGVVEENISQSGQEVTALVAENMGKGKSSVCLMAKAGDVQVIPIDIGINKAEKLENVLDCKVAMGTRNFVKEPAMTEQQAIQAIFTGMKLVQDCKEKGYDILATGEMGIGNTTTSSALAAELLSCNPESVTGKGAGLNEQGLLHKCNVIRDALQRYAPFKDPLYLLQCVGGLDIAGMAGICIGAGIYGVPVVLDGVISVVAAVLANRIVPGVKNYLIASHKSKEPAAEKLLQELRLKPVLDAELALGEGTGAVLLLAMLKPVMAVFYGESTFRTIHMDPYERL
ncbi:MAG: nicotinate-nucleotide--dimethylbenzimidazole phosphoribosyltransferase [Lachnospiraceae bacterium]|nr:nicotinate-nucleotide--dimethylbenzimidazole phosphoribosyltransferase [Lachnospiraceae bacterium]